MIGNALVVPTESPYDSNSLKRCLLTYDKVYLFSPEDRDIIPPSIYERLTTGLPWVIPSPVRPLGKIDDYDDCFETIIEEFDSAIKQGSLEVLPTPTDFKNIAFGDVPLPPDTPPADFVFGNYRNLISNPEFISVVSRGIDNNILLLSSDLDQLAPSGKEDGSYQLFVNGQQQFQQNHRKAKYDGFCSSEEERMVLTRLCHSRIGFLMKSIGYCESKGINAFTTDPGLAGTIQLLERNYQQIVLDAQKEEKIMLFDNLSKLEDLVFSEYIDSSALNNLSVAEILKIRTKSWGKANEGKNQLKTTLKEIALENKDSEIFIASCKSEIDKYLKDCNDYEHEAQKLKIRLLCNFGTILTGGTAGPPLLEQLIAAPTISLMVGLGSAMTFIYGEKRFPEILDLLKKQEEIKELKGYSLFRPYARLQ